jgi:hypothetical protein
MFLLNFQSAYKILFAAHLKHSSFWPPADVKPNDLALAELFKVLIKYNLLLL